MIKFQCHTRHFDHPAVIAQRFVKLLFAGDLFGDIKLPADLAVRIKQCYLMPTRRRVNGKRQPSRSRTDHRQIFFLHGRKDWHFGFMAGARIHQARGDFANEDLIETGLVAANTSVDLIGSSRLRF